MDLAAQRGLQNATVAHVLERSGVSRSTFYEHFRDKQDCLLAALRTLGEHLAQTVCDTFAEGDQRDCARSLTGTVTRFARERPAAARLLLVQTLGVSTAAMRTRDDLIIKLERLLTKAWEARDPAGPLIDLPPVAIVGGTFRALAVRLQDDSDVSGLCAELSIWMSSYEIPHGPAHWRSLSGPHAAHRSRPTPPRASAPRELPRGRHGLAAREIAHVHRERILHATAEVVSAKGFERATVADIISLAEVSRKVFYAHFADKHQAAIGAHELTVQRSIAAANNAFLSAPNWPDRVWVAIGALLESLASRPTFARLGVSEMHSASPATTRFLGARVSALTGLLHEGQHLRTEATGAPPIGYEIFAAVSFELCYQQLRNEPAEHLPGLLPLLTYLFLAPFIGPAQAKRFIGERVRPRRSEFDRERAPD